MTGAARKTGRARQATSGQHAANQVSGVEPVISRSGRREQLVVAALRLFSERPYEDVSIDDIANEANVAHGLLSYYFGGKRGAYLAALQMVQSDLQVLTRPIRSDGDIAAQIRGMARRHLEYFRAHPQLLLGLLASAPSDTETRAIEESTQTQATQALLDLLGLPENPPPMLRTALRGCMGFMQEVTIHWLSHDEHLEIEQLVELCFDATVAAVANAVDHPTPGVLSLTASSVAS
jgi:AcrR family transcriptional regulator